MKKIPISTYGETVNFAIVDNDDYEKVLSYSKKWHLDKFKTTCYVRCAIKKNGKWQSGKRMHTVIMNPLKGFVIDHLNNNGLDNRKKNLRVCRICENSRARHKVLSASGYKGVYMQKDGRPRKYQSYITVNKKRTIVRAFYTAKEAAAAYNSAAIVFHKQFAVLNKI